MKDEVSMGTWDAGNFDGDAPRDYLADLVGRWEQIIDRALAGEVPEEAAVFQFAPGLEMIDGCVMPTLEVILAAIEHLESDYCPELEKVTDWSRRALEAYDAEIEGWEPDDEYKLERRKVIARTFERLIAIARDRSEDSNDEG
jgi:hypothetical protein